MASVGQKPFSKFQQYMKIDYLKNRYIQYLKGEISEYDFVFES